MPELSRYKRTAQIAKFLIPALARIFSSKHAQTALSLGETGVALLQGKGAGSGWDLGAEVTAVMPFIRAGATVFDVGANKGEWSRAIVESEVASMALRIAASSVGSFSSRYIAT